MRWLLAPYTERRTYTIFLYLLLGLPMGILDFVVIATGLSLGLGLVVTILGIPVLVATLLVAQALAT
ncbi:MAG TPA: sensor domain-containing protein, partial [Actinomycetota bacterium]|nr:sensor domain-containing protein [Actinomycetota bacterium]